MWNFTKRTVPAILLGMFAFQTPAQVIVDTKLDRAEILIGEQVTLKATVSVNARQRVEFPSYAANDTLTAGVEVLKCGEVDTTVLNNGKRLSLTKEYLLTSFDSALYTLPALQVRVDGKDYKSRSHLGLKVNAVPVDTVHVDQYAPPFTVAETPFVWKNQLLLSSFVPWLLLLIFFICAVRLTSRKPIVRKIKVKPPVPPYKKATAALGQMNAENCTGADANKQFYMQLTDILRDYMQGRYGFYALEKTTTEIIDGMTEFVEDHLLVQLRELFTLADRVKFAKESSSALERKRCLDSAAHFLEETRSVEQENIKPKTLVVTLSGRKQRAIRVGLWIALVLFLLGSLACVTWAGWRIYEVYL